jgi:hypothetical protein
VDDDPQTVTTLIGRLSDDKFEVRQKATADLSKLGKLAEPALRQALTTQNDLEIRTRVQQILKDVTPDAPLPPSPSLLRLRVTILLEHAGTPETQRILQQLQQPRK